MTVWSIEGPGRLFLYPEEIMSRGLFIVLEGGEGTGKTTVANWLTARLTHHQRKAEEVADPGTSVLGLKLRELVKDKDIPMTPAQQMVLYTAARMSLVGEIEEKLAAGIDVVSGRWVLSTQVYQGVMGHIPVAQINSMHAMYVKLNPDICILLDCPPEVGLARKQQDDGVGAMMQDRWDSQDVSWHVQLRAAYRNLAEQAGYPIVDSSRMLDKVQDDVIEACKKNERFFAELGAF